MEKKNPPIHENTQTLPEPMMYLDPPLCWSSWDTSFFKFDLAVE